MTGPVRARAPRPCPGVSGCRRVERLVRDHGVMSGTVTPDRVVPARLPRVGYIPALDGLRALAVVAVLLYHGDVKWMPGGFLGVDVFFVISGYLITSLLLGDWREHHHIRFGRFYLRRARRLLPALFLMMGVVALYALLFLPDTVAELRGQSIAAIFYVENWYLIFHKVSYFVAVGRPSMLQHVWSLAVEEQFYLLWPLIFAFLLSRWGRQRNKLLARSSAACSRRRCSWPCCTSRSPTRHASTSAPTRARPRC